MPPVPASVRCGDRRYEPRSVATATATATARVVVDEELDGRVGDAEVRGHSLRAFVVQTLRDFVSRGNPEHGYVRVRYDECGQERAVPFAFKKRGVCSSCA